MEQAGDKFLRTWEKNNRVSTCQENGEGKEEEKNHAIGPRLVCSAMDVNKQWDKQRHRRSKGLASEKDWKTQCQEKHLVALADPWKKKTGKEGEKPASFCNNSEK